MLQLLNPIAKPIAEVLAAFYSVVPNYGVDILALSVVWMAIISPLTLKSTRSMLAMQALQPELKRLQEKHRNDRQAFAQAQMDLFRERNVSPFGSCLPMLLPLPVFFALFEVIDGLSKTVTVHGQVIANPRYLNHSTALYKSIIAAHGHLNAFGLDLSKNALSAHTSFAAAIPYFVLLLVMIATQYYQTAMTMSRNPAAQQNSQMKMMKFVPIIFGVVCIRFPAGVVLYYAMSNVCRIGQQWGMYRFDPKVKALVTTEVQEVEAKTRDIDRAAERRQANTDSPAGRSRFRDLLANAGNPTDQRPTGPPSAVGRSGTKGPGGRTGSRALPPGERDGKGTGAGRGAPDTGAPGAKAARVQRNGGQPAATSKANGKARSPGPTSSGAKAAAPRAKGGQGGVSAGQEGNPARDAKSGRLPAGQTNGRSATRQVSAASTESRQEPRDRRAPAPAGAPPALAAGGRNIPAGRRRSKKRRSH
jgi:YidC/Oxa1 family membrane protein insertase